MTAYVNYENGILKGGNIRHELSADGKEVMVGNYTEVYDHIRDILMPGDTYQEKHASTGTSSRVMTFGDMVLDWELVDAFDRGDPEYSTLSRNNRARYHAVDMVS